MHLKRNIVCSLHEEATRNNKRHQEATRGIMASSLIAMLGYVTLGCFMLVHVQGGSIPSKRDNYQVTSYSRLPNELRGVNPILRFNQLRSIFLNKFWSFDPSVMGILFKSLFRHLQNRYLIVLSVMIQSIYLWFWKDSNLAQNIKFDQKNEVRRWCQIGGGRGGA